MSFLYYNLNHHKQGNQMKKFITIFAVILAFLASETFAKSRSGGFSRSSSKSSWGSSSKKSTSSWGSKKSTSSWGSKKATATKPTSTKSYVKPKAVSKSKLDAKQSKKVASSKSAKRYTSKKEAESAARKDLKAKNTYTSSTPPATRPSHVPQNVTRDGQSYNVNYHRMSDGSYGYGYRDPTSGLLVSLLAADMIMDAAYMRNHGYAYGPAPRTTVVHTNHRQSTPMSAMGWVFTFLVLFIICGFIIWIIRRN
jgi:cobalamin biosynthesis Mg chelatase CobN